MNLLLAVMLIQSLNINKIEDQNTLYLMDKGISYYQTDWVKDFISNNYGFRTSQGCLDIEHWHQEYDAKAELPMTKSINLDYFFYERNGYNWHIERHELNFNFYRKSLKFTINISPNFLKRNDYAGIGVGLYKNKLMNAQLFLNLENFDHNYSIDRLYSDSIHDPYIKFPFQWELRCNYVGDIGYLNTDIRYTLPSTKKILYKANLLGYHNERNYSGRIFSALNLPDSLTLSTFSQWDYIYSQIDTFDYHYENALKTAFFTVALDYSGRIGKIHFSFPIYYKFNRFYDFPDSSNYSKVMYGITIRYSKYVSRNTILGIGYQRGIRERTINDSLFVGGYGDLENRLVVILGFNFSDKTRLRVIEGLELDHFPHIPISRIHNHTYVQIQYTP